MAVKYTIKLTPVKDLCLLLICERRVFDLSSAQQPEVELPPLSTDLQAHTTLSSFSSLCVLQIAFDA